VYKSAYRPPAFLVDDVELSFELDADDTIVESRLNVRRNPAAPEDSPLRLDGVGLELRALYLNGRSLGDGEYDVDADGLAIAEVPERFVLATDVVIHPARNTALLGLYRAGDLLCTQCEPEAFRRITFFPDRPDVLSRFRVTLTADAARYPILLSNGNPVATETLDGGRHRVTWEDPFPKPSYLFALVAGDLERVSDSFTTASGRRVAINLHVRRRDTGRCGHALDSLRRAMAWDEARYGREYDLTAFNMLAVSEYTMGAMENKGLNIFNDRRVLADPDTGTDRDHRDVEALVAHEYFHNWTGNRVTCRDWFQLALKEGFTVFREQQFVADQGWRDVRRIEDARLIRTRQFAEDAGPLAHPVRPESYEDIEIFYTDTVYSKGAEIVRMLALLLGTERFRAGTDLFFERHDGEAVRVEDFIRCMERVSGRDFSGFMQWYDHAGTPMLDVTANYDAVSAVYTLAIRQRPLPGTASSPAPPLHIPLAVGLVDKAGRSVPLQLDGEPAIAAATRVLEVTDTQARFRFVNVPSPPIPSLLRGFSAPVKVLFPYSTGQLATLAVHDPDPVARWDAVQRLFDRAVDGALAAMAGNRETGPDTADLEGVFRAMLQRDINNPGLLAELLRLPSDADLLLQRDGIDVDALIDARRKVARALAVALGSPLRETHNGCRSAPGTQYRPTPADCGRRSLRNVCLQYLMAAGGEDALARCIAQCHDDPTLTETLAALGLLCDTATPERDRALTAFHRRWADEPAMVDKWFAVQARSTHAGTVERLRELTRDPAFSRDQPNRVRSLVEVFAMENPSQFHRSDGAGYRFLADQVLALDSLNPSLAAVLLRNLGDWRRRDRRRADLMRSELERVAAEPALSVGTREVAAACL
jgi:aminopeptidase N